VEWGCAFFAIDPSQLLQVPQAGTEPLGVLFFVASVYAALVAFETGRTVSYFLCGLFIGLSNITRTLTIFTLPFFLVLIVLLVGARARAWRAASAAEAKADASGGAAAKRAAACR